ncbi:MULTISPECIES: hypothetical protein [unclassified Streptomyces]|uniref:hypothetical protein n=1 Tax=unclassified Streptomyces TaxID=2593676 RepID=UPI0038206B7F
MTGPDTPRKPNRWDTRRPKTPTPATQRPRPTNSRPDTAQTTERTAAHPPAPDPDRRLRRRNGTSPCTPAEW